jgi:hypothetical protein
MKFFLFFVIACGGSIYAYVRLRAGEVLRFETTSAPRQVTMTAVGLVASARRWATVSQGDGSANFTYAKGPNKFLLVIGFLFFLVPGIVYAILAGKKESLAVNTEEIGDMTVVQIASNGWRGKRAGRTLARQLALAPGSVAATASVAPPTLTPAVLPAQTAPEFQPLQGPRA